MRGLLAGTANALSMIVTNPLDVLKIRFQISEGDVSSIKNVRSMSIFQKAILIKNTEGYRGLFKGLSISMLRELTFSSGRVGFYEPAKDLLTPKGATDIGPIRKLLAGLISGAVSAAICNPTDVVKIRFQGDATPYGEKPRYSSVRRAFCVIYQTEGLIKGLYKGVFTTTTRSAVLSATQLASYDTIKNNVLKKRYPRLFPTDSVPLHFLSSIFAGVMTTLTSNPLDIARTRIMNQKASALGPGGQGGYSSNPFVTMYAIVHKEGLLALYKGFVPSYIRLGSCTVLFFVIYEQLRKIVGLKGV
uniref:Uncharacterized protein n=1 Tax=Arcella intermedia TaxID=1963864 RepID=A0A6B2LBC2_9EUKA